MIPDKLGRMNAQKMVQQNWLNLDKNMIISLMLYTFKSCSNIKISYEKIEVILKTINTEA